MPIAIALHVLAAVIWVGGMFFAYMALRPVAGSVLQAPERLTLWLGVFDKFFPWVWGCIVVLLASGYWMVFAVFGGMGQAGIHIHVMQAIGIVMMLLFMHIYFASFARLKNAVAEKEWANGGEQLGKIRRIVGTNLVLGILVVIVATGGRYV